MTGMLRQISVPFFLSHQNPISNRHPMVLNPLAALSARSEKSFLGKKKDETKVKLRSVKRPKKELWARFTRVEEISEKYVR